jgi:hypothetical protein
MTRRVLLLIILIFFYCNSHCQSYVSENYDCDLLNWRFEEIENPTTIDTVLVDVECLINRNQYDKGMGLLDSLIEKNHYNPDLYLLKAHFQERNNLFDTIYFNSYRIALELGADTGQTLYNLGALYYNYVIACNNSDSPVKVTASEKIDILNHAESVVKLAAYHDYKYLSYSYEFLSLSKEAKAEIMGEAIKPISLESKFDTLLLMSQLMDCGEFGGHIEYIKCYYQNEELKGVFWKDAPICEIEIPVVDKKQNDYKTDPQVISIKDLRQYLKHVLKIDKEPSSWTNAPTSFWVIRDNDPFFIRDWTGNCAEYESFRDKIFKK